MKIAEIIIALLVLIGIILILITIFRDPVLMIRTLLRGLKADRWRYKILLFPIWGPIYFLDKSLGLDIYISDIEESSKPKSIIFSEYEKYILIYKADLNYIKKQFQLIQDDFKQSDYKEDLSNASIKTAIFDENVLVKIEKEIDFNTFNWLVQIIDNSAPKDKVYNPKAILINNTAIEDSYFTSVDSAYPLKLIGKTYGNKKLYVDINTNNPTKEILYYNSNLDYIKNIDFDYFTKQIKILKFEELKINPAHNKQ